VNRRADGLEGDDSDPRGSGGASTATERCRDAGESSIRAGDVYEIESEPIRNPVTGPEITPGVMLPQGTIFKEGRFGSSERLRVDPLGIDHTGRYTAVVSFEYRGP
jgi:hypothetical protein